MTTLSEALSGYSDPKYEGEDMPLAQVLARSGVQWGAPPPSRSILARTYGNSPKEYLELLTSNLNEKLEVFGDPRPLNRERFAKMMELFGPAGMTAFHGSPHRFAPTPKNPLGEFDASRIGTGEGAS